ncbi:MAG: LysR family transcriptional regulator [Lachnospiraceae bacterium]|nr:LysR family transcriptional regulator [Lachnospiraceae bacterium]
MELLQLKYFREVAQCGKISTAAKKLYISAPGLSATIGRLEKELGTKLFTRTGNSITLSPEGEIFLRYVNQALTSLDAGKAELLSLSEKGRHHVRVAATTSNLWVGLLSAFSFEYPHITISNTSVKLKEIPEESIFPRFNFLLAEKDDLPRHSSNVFNSSILIKKDRPVLMVPNDHRLAGCEEIDLREISDENFLLPVADMSLHRTATELLDAAGVSKGNLYECSYMLRRQMVLEHRGIAFSTEYTSRSEDSSMRYVPVSYPESTLSHYIFWDAGHVLTEDENTFLNFAKEFFNT